MTGYDILLRFNYPIKLTVGMYLSDTQRVDFVCALLAFSVESDNEVSGTTDITSKRFSRPYMQFFYYLFFHTWYNASEPSQKP